MRTPLPSTKRSSQILTNYMRMSSNLDPLIEKSQIEIELIQDLTK
uniref:Uncharacterized protein n=1 Tax=Rhizophora mucronata TaxID=61149 RepID=A0A2P2PAR0_RHIMU